MAGSHPSVTAMGRARSPSRWRVLVRRVPAASGRRGGSPAGRQLPLVPHVADDDLHGGRARDGDQGPPMPAARLREDREDDHSGFSRTVLLMMID